ncbi:S49 family peptidase [Paucibacter sp. APW11]|uniref:S49 family peptidase n=2 Tax=Roseateles aquae TaxID=3077235 RepID=A0ABU3PFE6_9BURK|nr:S49 family peptidase [Paucibacter sp. APW11]MDT9001299.1 S49 family peptidase [Paucibacter sp. APW11]
MLAAQPAAAAAARPAPASDAAGARAPATTNYEPLLQQLAADYLRDRRSERRWRSFYRLAWLATLLTLVWWFFFQSHHVSAPSTPHTALVEVRGEIASDTEASAELLLSAIRSAFEDHGAQAVVLRINSPGGSPVQAGIVYDEIKRLKAKHGKKVYAVVEEICASGAYYIAAAADEIYVDKASVVGSIGVLMDGFGFTGLMEKLGVERRLLTAGENKGMLDPYTPLNAKQRGYAQAMLDQIHRQFIAVVREGRGDRLKETPEMFSGLFWNGEEAVKMGLADDLGNLDFVAREVVKAEEVIDYTPRDNVAERLAKRFGAAMGEGAVKAVRNLAPIR